MAREDFATPGGSLKLKGVHNSKIDKKKKKKKPRPATAANPEAEGSPAGDAKDKDEYLKRDGSETNKAGDELVEAEGDGDGEKEPYVGKTEAEKRHEEMRRRRLDERLKREGVKSHKEKVEELNKYLSNLSEHHDMPRIGPG